MSNALSFSPALPEATYPAAISLRELWPWTLFAIAMLMLVYLVGVEDGGLSVGRGQYVHEFLHDGRHLLGFPCH